MGWICRARWLAAACLACGFALISTSPSAGQALGLGRFELSNNIRLDEADSATRTHLEQVRAFLDSDQWDEAVETLRQVTENHGGKVIGLTPQRYISVRDYCHLLMAALPPEALELYRSRVDPQAERWYRQGVAERAVEPLRAIVEQLFCSSWGDEALEALGELALEQGDYGNARGYWQRILPPAYWLKLKPELAREDGTPMVLVYPDTNLPLVEIRAQLVLLLILEGDADSAGALEDFAQEFGSTEGKLGGRQVVYAERLGELLAESRQWPRPKANDDWPTFAGSPTRNKVVSHGVKLGALLWRQPLSPAPAPDFSYSVRRVAERKDAMLSYHPLLVDGLVLVNTADEIYAHDAKTGAPAWGGDPVIFSSHRADQGLARALNAARHSSLGAPRFTMTACNGRLYARMGNPVTSSTHEAFGQPLAGYLVCLDLKAQGKMLWDSRRSMLREEGWTFEGSPLSDGEHVYVAMRRSGVQPQAYVACLDAEQGRLRWRRLICSAESPAQAQSEEITHNLLTLDHGTLYYNTNLGAVAAIDARDGQPRWISCYRRVETIEVNDRAKHLYRDLTPCLYDRGVVYAAPADCRDVLAFDASDGLLVWHTPHADDGVHLLGIGGGNLLVGGDKLWWIRTDNGKAVRDPFPSSPPLKGFGRGVLAGDYVYWPTQTMIYVFDQKTGDQKSGIELSTRGTNISGGNLLVNGDSLLIATSHELLAFSPTSGWRDGEAPERARQEISRNEQGTVEHARRK